MAVDESLNALSTTASSNTPAGADIVGVDLDNHLRDIKKNIRIAAEHAQGILNPTGFAGQLHADRSRSASGIITLRLHDGDAFQDLLEFKTADNNIAVLNLADSAIPAVKVQAGDFSASTIAQVAVDAGLPWDVTQGGIGQESSASTSAYINVMLGTLLALSRKATVGDADIAISSEVTGDILVHGGAGGDWNRFGIGSASEILHVSGSTLTYRTPPQPVLQADQAALEAETDEDTYAPPDLLQHSPGVAKVWADFTIAGSVNASKNVSSVTDTGTGDWKVNLTTAFSGTNYAIIALPDADPNGGTDGLAGMIDGQAAGTYDVRCANKAADATDPNRGMYTVAFGDQ